MNAQENVETLAVKMRGGFKRYTPTAVILRGMNITIRRGTIYGLLGPSGCGKTTLLSCIVGRKTLDSGSLELAYTKRKQIGYMPQEIALNTELTIMEVFVYYGRLYEMEYDLLYRKAAELIQFLELPPQDRKIGDCSGGQQRRVSMAVTLLHNPELLILDEPTVGVDPILCHKIWEVFKDLVHNQGKTIVITTHYIEEARAAHTIGLMRGGVLLAEESPQSLMVRFECETLEDVFLQLSRKQGEDNAFTGTYPPIMKLESPFSNDGGLLSMTRLKAQLQKNLIWTYRNIAVTIFVILVPVVSVAICCTVNLKDMILNPIGLLSHERHDCHFPTNQTIRSCLTHTDFYCSYLNILRSRYPVIEYNDDMLANYDGKRGFIVAIVEVPNNFTEGVMERLEKQMTSSQRTIDQSTLSVRSDMSNASLPASRPPNYTHHSDLYLQQWCPDQILLRHIRLPWKFMKRCKIFSGSFAKSAVSIRDYPECQSRFVFYMTFVYSSTAIMMEKQAGLLERYQIAGLTLVEVLIAQAVIQMVILNIQTILLFIVTFGWFGNLMVGSVVSAYFLLVLSELFGMAYGVLLALAMNDESALMYAGIGSMLASFGLCGGFWPIEGQHFTMQYLGKLLPLTHAVKAFASITIRGWGFSYWLVSWGFICPFFATVGIFSFTAFLVRRKVIQV